MELIKTRYQPGLCRPPQTGLPAIRPAHLAMTVVILVARGGPNYGIDFAGGVLVQVRVFPSPPMPKPLKKP